MAYHQRQLMPNAVPVRPTSAQPLQDCSLGSDPNAALLSRIMIPLVQNLSQTIVGLSTLPGASKLISPDMATVAHGFARCATAQHSTAGSTPRPADTLNNLSHVSTQSPAVYIQQHPATPPSRAPSTAQQSPSTAATGFGYLLQAAALPSPAQLQMPLALGAISTAPMVQQHGMLANPPAMPGIYPAAPLPVHRTLEDDVSSSSGSDGSAGGQHATSYKRACTEAMRAHQALQATLALRQQGRINSPLQGSAAMLAAMQAQAVAAAAAATPFAAPGLLPYAGLAAGQQYEAQHAQVKRALSLANLFDAAETLASMHSGSGDAGNAADEAHIVVASAAAAAAAAEAAVAAPVVPKSVPKPRRRTAGSKAARTQKGHKDVFNCTVADLPEAVHQQVRALWEEGGQSLPVYCYNKTTGAGMVGRFRLVEGKRKIVTPTGEVLDPVDFEKAAGRLATRNWQISIMVAGVTTQPGGKLMLGHATRILGIHNPSTSQ